MPGLYIVAVPNGAGKTTAAYSLLPNVFKTVEYVNADEIDRGLSPLNVKGVALQAGRIMLERLDYLINRNESFAFETTLSGLAYLKFIRQAKAAAIRLHSFMYGCTASSYLLKEQQGGLSKGGHHIPADINERRYEKSIANFGRYAALDNDWYVYNNSNIAYALVAKFTNGKTEIFDSAIYIKLNSHD